MTITAEERKDDWSGTDSTEVRPYLVRTSDPTTAFHEIVESGQIPKVRDRLPTNNNYMVENGGITGERLKRGNDGQDGLWYVVVTYTKQGYSFSTTNQPSLDRLLAFQVSTIRYTRTAESAYEKIKPTTPPETVTSETRDIKIVNSAEDQFDPADLQEEYYHPVLVFRQRERDDFAYVDAIGYIGTLNAAKLTVLGVEIPKGQAMLRKVNPQLIINEDGAQEWQCDYEVELNEELNADVPSDFWLNLLDSGFQAFFETTPGETEKRKIKQSDVNTTIVAQSKDDSEISDPWPLNGSGAIAEGTEEDEGIYLRYRTRKYADWEKSLNLISKAIKIR